GWATLPAAAWRQGVALASRSAVPAEVLAGSLDRRRLGARVSAITLRSGRLVRRLAAADPAFDGAPGWHAAEAEDAVAWRWTEGEALLPAGAFAGFDPSEPVALRVELMGGLCYFVAEGERRAA
ncbi:MAG: hypothetical protein K2X11_13760, partial [Acetobacteraceae bacterium]|nr:hypothetical protein [Acetobacteraceae bacterium]